MDILILIIDDSDDDVFMITRAFKKGLLGNKLHYAKNGKDGLDYLQSEEGKDIGLILLDLNMDIMDGFDFLREYRRILGSYRIPIVVFTTSRRTVDIEKAFDLGANCYVEKPFKPDEFIDAILKIEDFWIYFSKTP